MNILSRALRDRIVELFPEIRRFGLGVSVDSDRPNDSFNVSFSSGSEIGRTRVESHDASDCLERGECTHLGIQLGQVLRNSCDRTHACAI